jgi:hypothetical protein
MMHKAPMSTPSLGYHHHRAIRQRSCSDQSIFLCSRLAASYQNSALAISNEVGHASLIDTRELRIEPRRHRMQVMRCGKKKGDLGHGTRPSCHRCFPRRLRVRYASESPENLRQGTLGSRAHFSGIQDTIAHVFALL